MRDTHTPKQGLKQGLKEKRMPTCTRLFLVQSTTPSRVPPAMMNLSFSQSGTFRELSPATLAGTRRQAGRKFPARTRGRESPRERGATTAAASGERGLCTVRSVRPPFALLLLWRCTVK